METKITLTLTPEGKLELPQEIRDYFSNTQQYSVIIAEDTIIFKKIPQFDWDEWQNNLTESGDTLDEITTKEICDMVREVRHQNSQNCNSEP
mgnify:CR=1 FL=1